MIELFGMFLVEWDVIIIIFKFGIDELVSFCVDFVG